MNEIADDPSESLYQRRAEVYDGIYHAKDYAGESDALHQLLAEEGVPEGARLLDAACGTGAHLVHLRQWYDVSGFDASQPMLRIARAKLSGVELWQGDLVDFEVATRFPVITCLFSAIGYVFPLPRLERSALTFSRALAPGGIALIEPWVQPDRFRDGMVGLEIATHAIPKLARVSTSIREGTMTKLHFEWLVGHPDRIERFAENHDLWMATREELTGAFEEAGLHVRWEDPGPMGRGLLVAKKDG